jgi:hypothetical protein
MSRVNQIRIEDEYTDDNNTEVMKRLCGTMPPSETPDTTADSARGRLSDFARSQSDHMYGKVCSMNTAPEKQQAASVVDRLTRGERIL